MMKNTIHPDSDLIEQAGGTCAVADLLNIKPSSVSEWRVSGIPQARAQTLALLRPDIFGCHHHAIPQDRIERVAAQAKAA